MSPVPRTNFVEKGEIRFRHAIATGCVLALLMYRASYILVTIILKSMVEA